MANRGDKYGKWTIVEGIDRGGQGVVYRATGAEGEPEVAIKIVQAHRLKKRERFLREISVQQRLTEQSAPNVMPLLDSNFSELQEGGVSGYLVMPLASLSLEDVLATTIGRIELALEIFAGILNGVGAAHAAEVIHRDLKPANILFPDSSLRKPLVADFGICLLKESSDAKRLTEEGETVGAKYFMAPEQERGGVSTVTYAADIYALGKLLHHMITGRNLYREEIDTAFTAAELQRDPRYGLILTEVISRTVVHEPDARIQSIPELKEIVRTLHSGAPPLAEEVREDSNDQEEAALGGAAPIADATEPTSPLESDVQAEYERFMGMAGRGESAAHLMTLDAMRRDFQHKWEVLHERIKEDPQRAPPAVRELIADQPHAVALALALGRSNATDLFPGFRHFLEDTLREDEPRSGYPQVTSVPNALGGFLYMAAVTQALRYESWEVLTLLVNEKIEWYYRSGRPMYSFGFSVSFFFHGDALGREASKIHDLFRELLMDSDLRPIFAISDEALLTNTYRLSSFFLSASRKS